jgi:hypothetical protein
MAQFRITGVWKDSNNVITYYAFHTVGNGSTTRGVKTSKAQAISLLESPENSATTWIWNYTKEIWSIGETVQVINGDKGKFLRSKHDNSIVDNLSHLIDYDWINS